jgi:hypothetical protein
MITSHHFASLFCLAKSQAQTFGTVQTANMACRVPKNLIFLQCSCGDSSASEVSRIANIKKEHDQSSPSSFSDWVPID